MRYKHKYYFGRVDIFSAKDNNREIISRALMSNRVSVFRRFKYGFFDANEITFKNHDFISGVLVKFKQVYEKEVVDESIHQVVDGGLQDGVVAKAAFYLDYRSKVIAYRPILNQISAKQFCYIFSRLIEQFNDELFVRCYVESINESMKIEDAINKFEVINRIGVEVHPTNPHNRELYQNIDNRLKVLEADSYKQEISGGANGLNKQKIVEDDSYKGLIMASDGYGKGFVEGIVNGEKMVVNTYDSPEICEVNDVDSLEGFLRQLFKRFEKIWNRKQ